MLIFVLVCELSRFYVELKGVFRFKNHENDGRNRKIKDSLPTILLGTVLLIDPVCKGTRLP